MPKFRNVPSENIRAVRGRLTLKHLQSLRSDIGDLPLGDPGIFADELLAGDMAHPPSARYRAAVVPPHYQSAGKDIYRSSPRLTTSSWSICATTASSPCGQSGISDVVISQSLHGLVFATALRKALRLDLSQYGRSLVLQVPRLVLALSTTHKDAPLPLDCDLEDADQGFASKELRPLTAPRCSPLFHGTTLATMTAILCLDFRSVRAMTPPVLRLDWAQVRCSLRETGTFRMKRACRR